METRLYIEADIKSISREKLLVLLYEKMANDLLEARLAIAANNRIRMADRITHSQQIISELHHALDHEIGGEISRNLEALYDFMFVEHLEILVDQDPRHVDNCLAVLSPLLAAWREIPPGTADEEQARNNQPSSLFSVSA